MKLLKKLLLINWHYIGHQTIEFENINFLTGKNASGKSTIIDALQLLILGDTNGHYFNQAANENSRRTLKGYLKGELTDDGETGFIYLRDGIFSSYIAGEFYDTIKKHSFTFGVVFDVYHEEKPEHKFFLIEGPIPANDFIEEATPWDAKTLRNKLSSNRKIKFQFYDTNKSYQEAFRGKMGSINAKFFSLFKKSVPFSPIMDIEKFISEFVCDVSNKIDIADMQENIRYYKQLEQDVEMVNGRIQRLENIDTKYVDYETENARFQEQSYLMDRAAAKQAEMEINELRGKIEQKTAQIGEFSLQLTAKDKAIKELEQEEKKLWKDKYESDIFKKGESLEKDKMFLKDKLAKIENLMETMERKIRNHGYLWRVNIETLAQLEPETVGGKPEFAGQLQEDARYLAGVRRHDLAGFDLDRLHATAAQMRTYKDYLSRVYYEHDSSLHAVAEQENELAADIDSLKKGIKPYDKKLTELRAEIKANLAALAGREVPVDIFCELMEMRDPKWQDAVEGYLHTQKFYLIVPPEYFVSALQIYDRLKFQRHYYDIGLVDIEKIAHLCPRVEKGSLAEEVITDNPLARLFVDFLLGKVIKCEQVEDLRKHRTAITPTGMLYHNFTARQLNPDRWKIPYIGKKSIEEQLKIKEAAINNLLQKKESLAVKVKTLAGLNQIQPVTEGEIQSITAELAEIRHYQQNKEDLQKIINELSQLDLTYLEKLDRLLKEVEERKSTAEAQRDQLNNTISRLRFEVENKEREKLPKAEEKLAEAADRLIIYDASWVQQTGEVRFAKELAERKNPENILSAFSAQIARSISQRQKKWEDLINERAAYNRDYKMSYDINLKGNQSFTNELTDLRDTQLASYSDKIKDAQDKAQRQFQEDFISKLKQNIDTVKNQITELNDALKSMSFGTTTYHFEIKANLYYKKFYDMINDTMLLEGFNLFSTEFQSKHRDAIDELFKQIVDVGEGSLSSDQRAELEKNIVKFTDYRTYLNFDLISTDEMGRESRLSRMISKKSGGETQTPFYISVLASFARIYRLKQGRGETANTMRLVIFDEAFSKMDHQRIEESIKLLKKLGLQAIISAPTEKIGDIAPVVDRNLCVTRIKETTIIKAFDPRELLEEDYGLPGADFRPAAGQV